MRKITIIYSVIAAILFLLHPTIAIAQPNPNQQQLIQGAWQCVERKLLDDNHQPIEQKMDFDNAELPMFPDNINIEKQTISLLRQQNSLQATWQIDSTILKINTADTQALAQFTIINVSEEELILALPKKDPNDAYTLQTIFKRKK